MNLTEQEEREREAWRYNGPVHQFTEQERRELKRAGLKRELANAAWAILAILFMFALAVLVGLANDMPM